MDIEALGKQKAQDAVDFITSLQHVKDPWHGVYFDLLSWQERIIRDVYGTLKPDGTRQIKHVYLEIPKKQGKSELVAAIGLKQLCADGERFAEVYGCAADREQASIIFDVAVEMVAQEPELAEACKIVPSKKRIVYLPTKSFYQVLSSESYTKHGLNVSTVLFDEIHAQPNRELYDVMTFGSGDARLQPLYWYITTAGDDPDRTSIGWEVHQKAEALLLGEKEDPTWYPVIFGHDPEERRVWTGWGFETYEAPEEDQAQDPWEDEELWQAVNPSLIMEPGKKGTVKFETLKEAYQTVKDNPAEERLFRQLRLNEWVKFKSSKWLPVDVWDQNTGLIVPERLRGRECYGGLDLSSTVDITAFVLLFPPDGDDKKYTVLRRCWIPADNMAERVKRDHVPYDRWVRQGLIETTPGNVIDYAFIEQEIISLRDEYNILEIGFDPWNALQTSLRLTDAGLEMMETRQGFKTLSPAMRRLEALIKGRHINHGNDPVLRWMFGNLEVKIDENDNIRPIKGKSTERIDGIVALLNALSRYVLHEDTRSAYEDRGILVLGE